MQGERYCTCKGIYLYFNIVMVLKYHIISEARHGRIIFNNILVLFLKKHLLGLRAFAHKRIIKKRSLKSAFVVFLPV